MKRRPAYGMHETGLFDFNPINHCCSNNRTISELKEFTTKHVCQALKSLVKVCLRSHCPINISLVVYDFRSQGQYHLVQG